MFILLLSLGSVRGQEGRTQCSRHSVCAELQYELAACCTRVWLVCLSLVLCALVLDNRQQPHKVLYLPTGAKHVWCYGFSFSLAASPSMTGGGPKYLH